MGDGTVKDRMDDQVGFLTNFIIRPMTSKERAWFFYWSITLPEANIQKNWEETLTWRLHGKLASFSLLCSFVYALCLRKQERSVRWRPSCAASLDCFWLLRRLFGSLDLGRLDQWWDERPL